MKMNYNKENIKMQKKYSHHMLLLLVPSIAIALIIVVGIVFVPNVVVIQSAAAQSSSSQQLPQQQQQQQNQNNNISLATSSEAARNLAQKSGINSTEVSTKPVQNASELTQKLAPGGSLANFQGQLNGLGQQLGMNGTILSQIKQQISSVNPTQLAQQLDQALDYIP
jgi:cytoskeletal protein RodZ